LNINENSYKFLFTNIGIGNFDFIISQTIKTNTKCFATNLCYRLCCFGI